MKCPKRMLVKSSGSPFVFADSAPAARQSRRLEFVIDRGVVASSVESLIVYTLSFDDAFTSRTSSNPPRNEYPKMSLTEYPHDALMQIPKSTPEYPIFS